MEDKRIQIELSEEDLKLFVKFRKRQSDFEILEANGVFDFKNGVAFLHRDSNGKLRGVEINKKVYNA